MLAELSTEMTPLTGVACRSDLHGDNTQRAGAGTCWKFLEERAEMKGGVLSLQKSSSTREADTGHCWAMLVRTSRARHYL